MTVEERAADVADLLHGRLGAGGRDLEARVRRAGRALPRRIRREAAVLVEAEKMSAHPRLGRRIDEDAVSRAHAACRRYLETVDVWGRRRGMALNLIAANAFNLLVVALVVLAVLVWRGFV